MTQQQVVVVLGMPRSGTSVIARSLKVFDIALGDQLTKASQSWNPTGFWEDSEIVNRINREVLYTLNYAWMSVSLVNYDPELPAILALKEKAVELLKHKIAHHPIWGFKDPRTAKILPFWQSVFKTLGVKDHYLITLRNPLATAYSNQALSDYDLSNGLLIWLMHLMPAIQETTLKSRLVVSYDKMLENPNHELNRMSQYLQLPINDTEKNLYIGSYLDKQLAHYSKYNPAFKTHPATSAVPLCLSLYQLLTALAEDQIEFDRVAFNEVWEPIQTSFVDSYPNFLYLDHLLKKNKSLEKSLRSIKRSIPWKLIYPLRMVDDCLRWYRQKNREKKRLVRQHA